MEVDALLQSAVDILKAAKDRLKAVVSREADATKKEDALAKREADLATALAKLSEQAKAENALINLKKAQDELNTERIALGNAQAAFENSTVEVRERLRAQESKAQEIAEAAEQVRRDKAALIEERKNMKASILKEINDRLKG